MALNFSARARDRYYTLFLYSYIPTILFFDAISIYPPSLVPSALLRLHAWYITQFNDELARRLPAWYRFFFYTEVAYQLPASVLLVRQLRARRPAAAAHALVWALVCGLTTATCVFEILVGEMGGEGEGVGDAGVGTGMTPSERCVLAALYGGYGVVFAVVGVDMFVRIVRALGVAAKVEAREKEE